MKFIFPGLLLIGCHSREIIYREHPPAIDNIWLNDNTLQIIVPGTSTDTMLPEIYRMEKACINAENSIDAHLLAIYPNATRIRPERKIIYKLYGSDGQCRIVVNLSKSNLKKELP